MPCALPPKRCWRSRSSASSSGSPDTVATTGVCRVHPGAINSIPDRVTLEIDVRDIDLGRRDRRPGRPSGKRSNRSPRGGRSRRWSNVSTPTRPPSTSGVVVEAIGAACGELGIKGLSMISRAYHDSLFMARIAPTGMIFIPCRDGISHRPDEYSSPEAIAQRSRSAGACARPAGRGRRIAYMVFAFKRVEVFR